MNAALPRVKELYASGEVTPVEDVAPAGEESVEPRADAGATPGPAAASACEASDLRRALEAGDEAFLKRLAGKPVVVDGMVLKPPKLQGPVALAELMAGGGSLAVAFPPDTQAAALPMGTKIVVTGEAAKVDGRWLLRASEWGRPSEAKAGRPLTRLSWPESGAGPAE